MLQLQGAADRDSDCCAEDDGCNDHRKRLKDEDAQQLETRKERRQRKTRHQICLAFRVFWEVLSDLGRRRVEIMEFPQMVKATIFRGAH